MMLLYVIAGSRDEFREFMRITKTHPDAAVMVQGPEDLPREAGHAVVFYGSWQKNPAFGKAQCLASVGHIERIQPAA